MIEINSNDSDILSEPKPWPAGCGRAMGEGRGAEGGIIKVNKILDILSAVGGNNERNITSQSVRV